MNPFLIQNYSEPYYFCNREDETNFLIQNINKQYNTTFFSQRRIGKTALVKHVFYQLKKKKKTCIYLDIYATQNLLDLTNELANSIYNVLQKQKSTAKKYWESIKLLRPILKINEFSGELELSLDISTGQQYQKTVAQLLQFLDALKIKVVIAIDEFQQILNYPEKNVEAILRTSIQQLKNVQFIFLGSNQKMMHEIFNTSKRPFYASSKNLHLQQIDPIVYGQFIKKHFENNNFKIEKTALDRILDLTNCHTYFTQQVCHDLYASNSKKINENSVLKTINSILLENQSVYFQYRSMLTDSQWKLLIAISKKQKVYKPYGQNFIKSNNLNTPASIKRSLESLLTKGLVYYNNAIEVPYYETQDKFLSIWLRNKYQ